MKQKYLAIAMLAFLLTIYKIAGAETQASPNVMTQTLPPSTPQTSQLPSNSPQQNSMPNQMENTTNNNPVPETEVDSGKRMTVIDENGNLKMVEVPGGSDSTSSNTQSSTLPSIQSTPAMQPPAQSPPTPPLPTDGNNLPSAPQSASPPSPPSGTTTPSAPAGMEPPLPLDNSPTNSNLNNINQAVP